MFRKHEGLILVNLLVRCNDEDYGKMTRRLQICKVWERSKRADVPKRVPVRIGRRGWQHLSIRTNLTGIQLLEDIAADFGLRIEAVF